MGMFYTKNRQIIICCFCTKYINIKKTLSVLILINIFFSKSKTNYVLFYFIPIASILKVLMLCWCLSLFYCWKYQYHFISTLCNLWFTRWLILKICVEKNEISLKVHLYEILNSYEYLPVDIQTVLDQL